MFFHLSEERRRTDEDFKAFKIDLLNYMELHHQENMTLNEKVKELNDRVEMLTPANVIKAAQQSTDETIQVPMKMSRTVDWRTKRLELEKKYGKGEVRENLVKEISSPAEIFQDR